jgi:hypothetical protein
MILKKEEVSFVAKHNIGNIKSKIKRVLITDDEIVIVTGDIHEGQFVSIDALTHTNSSVVINFGHNIYEK